MRILLLVIVVSLFVTHTRAQVSTRPRLVVGIVVDQMRYEYLQRYAAKFGEGGFKRLAEGGFLLRNAHYHYMPTLTGPGHASIYTGSTPAIHGIIGNDYYDKQSDKLVNCVEDSRFAPVGNEAAKGNISPWRMLSTTITDELKISTQSRSKIIGISIKDRSAVLPAGHMGDAAYWYDRSSGRFITSTYYRSALPEWLLKFNALNLAEIYLSQEWKTLLPLDQYTESGPDESPYERKFTGKDKTTFPYKLADLRKQNGDFELLPSTPFANDLLTELTKATVAGEKLGKDEVTDFLCVSYSATDVIGHQFGPQSVEVEDAYLRLDRNLSDLFKTLDKEVGPGNYTVFLTADHAVAEVPQFLRDNKISAGYFNESRLKASLDEFLANYFSGKSMIARIINEQIYLDHDAFQKDPRASGIDLLIATELIGKFLLTQEGVANYYPAAMIRQGSYEEKGPRGMVIRGYNPKRSGDIMIVMEPGWVDSGTVPGTTHGSLYSYDTHVPILFYGKGITKGTSVQYHTIADIAPTLSLLLGTKFPNGCTGQPIQEILDK